MKLLQYVTLPNVSPSPCKLYTNINQLTNEIQSHFIECHMGSHYIHVTCSIIRLTHVVAHLLQFWEKRRGAIDNGGFEWEWSDEYAKFGKILDRYWWSARISGANLLIDVSEFLGYLFPFI